MPSSPLSPSTQRDLERACQKAAEKVRKLVPGKSNKATAMKYFNRQLCKEVDQKLLKALAREIAKQTTKHNAKPLKDTPKAPLTGVPKMSPPNKGVPTLTIPMPWTLPLESLTGNPGAKGKFEIKVWADPRKPDGEAKGGMLNFTAIF